MSDPYRSRSLWLDQFPGSLEPRTALDGDTDVDVAIVGGGYTGLWTAYYLLKADPSLRVIVIERDIVGFGASGRNGGWCLGEMAVPYETLERTGGRDGAIRQIAAAAATVDEVGRVVAGEGIDCGFAHGGSVRVARNPGQVARMKEEVEHHRHLGFGEDVTCWLSADQARARLGATGVLGGVYYGPAAAVDPAGLVRGLATAVERAGGRIVEKTAALSIGPGLVSTDHGEVRAEAVIRATEGYTSGLDGHRRTLLPLYSLMVATEPLPDEVWDQIGLAQRETFADGRHMVIYGQRTADDRIAFGGRGAPYGYGSRIDPEIESNSGTHDLIIQTLLELFPFLADFDITHRWGGVLGVPRDWFPSVGFDRETGVGWAGGYVGEGVAISNLAGRTLADLVTGSESEITDLPWVQHRSRLWEPEPLRWMEINGALKVMGAADSLENRSTRESRVAKLMWKLIR